MNYDDLQNILDGDRELTQRLRAYPARDTKIDRLAHSLHRRRKDRGTYRFDLPERFERTATKALSRESEVP